MSAAKYLTRLSPDTAKSAVASVAARLLANPTQAAKLENIDPLTPAAADLRSMVGPGMGIDELVQALEPGAGHWWTRAAFHDISTAAVQTLARVATPPVHRAFLTTVQAEDFRDQTVMFGFHGVKLEEAGEAGETRIYGADAGISDSATGRVVNYAAAVAIYRSQIINDKRIQFLGRIGESLLASSYRKEAELVYGTLEDNPNLSDGSPWFDESNTASAPSVLQGLIDGFELLASQTLPDGSMMNAQPTVLVIPPGWSIRASDVIADILLNVGRLSVIKSGSVSAGYLFASPDECPAYGLLGFQPGAVPEIRVARRPRSGFITDMELMVKANHPIAPLPLSRRGVVKIEVAS